MLKSYGKTFPSNWSSFQVFLSDYGKLLIELKTPDNSLVKFQNFEKSFNDGRWYELSLQIFSNKLLLRVNEEQAVTNRLITVVTGSSIYFGGMLHLFQVKLKLNAFHVA